MFHNFFSHLNHMGVSVTATSHQRLSSMTVQRRTALGNLILAPWRATGPRTGSAGTIGSLLATFARAMVSSSPPPRRSIPSALTPFLMASALAIISTAWVSPASAHTHDAYHRGGLGAGLPIDNDPVADHSNWMEPLSGDLRLSELSLPGTHDTMSDCENRPVDSVCAFNPTYDITTTQAMSLSAQLTSGIRLLDIRVLNKDRNDGRGVRLHIVHGLAYLGYDFEDDVLEPAKTFLSTHPDETIIMLVSLDDRGDDPRGP